MAEPLIGTAYTLPVPAADTRTEAWVVAVEATRFRREVRGIGRYVRALLPRLVALRPGLRLVLFVKRARDVEPVHAMLDELHGMRGRVDVRPVREMSRTKADVFWYPWNTASPTPASGAVVATMHDIVPIAHPDPRWRGWQKNMRWRRRYGATATRATLIIADSQFTADEIHRMLAVPHERMRVVLLAADDFPIPPAAHDTEMLQRLGVRAPYVLAVGAADRRKNLPVLDRAMPTVVATHPDVTLVLAGPRRDDQAEMQRAPWRKTLGFVSEDQLAALYRGASALVMPSTYEGFGLPVLEAMQLGTPVICARSSSLPEVGGDAAMWIEAGDDAELARKITLVVGDASVHARMRAASLERAARFSWNETARQTLAIFDEALALSGRPAR
ncbi:MAG: glycosyltransferase family 4 protein [Gemmatimonadota bacterium]|nr:glycosyltransferase family 4 protein [Gemmatimonadota bacterium]